MHNVVNVIHHDIKPENLLVDSQDNIKITDFGASILMNSSSDDGLVNYDWGTRLYLPPECWTSRPELLRNADERQTT